MDDDDFKRLIAVMHRARGDVVDLRHETSFAVISLLALLVGTGGFVLHGTNRSDGDSRLEPRAANDVFRASGNRLGVYASVDWIEVILHALLDSDYLRERLTSVVVGYRRMGGRSYMKVTPNLFRLLAEQEPRVWRAGMIYVLRRSEFEASPDSSSEVFSSTGVTAEARLIINADLSSAVTGPSDAPLARVFVYSPTELDALRETVR